MTTLSQTQRRIGISLIWGVGTTFTLSALSMLAIRLFPYRDLPMMPKPFFIYALAPGIIIGEWFPHGWAEIIFFLTNSLAYGVVAFFVTTLIHASSRQA